MVRFMSFRNKEEIIKIAWQKRGFEYDGRKVYLDHDYAPDILKKCKEYTEAIISFEREENTLPNTISSETKGVLRQRDLSLQHG